MPIIYLHAPVKRTTSQRQAVINVRRMRDGALGRDSLQVPGCAIPATEDSQYSTAALRAVLASHRRNRVPSSGTVPTVQCREPSAYVKTHPARLAVTLSLCALRVFPRHARRQGFLIVLRSFLRRPIIPVAGKNDVIQVPHTLKTLVTKPTYPRLSPRTQ